MTFDLPARPPGALRVAFDGAATVFGTAARLLWRHWPALAALYLAGDAAHELLLRGAVAVSDVHAMAGVLVLVLAPVATLVAFILMLHVMRPSLPWLSALHRDRPPDGPRWTLLNKVGSVLIPFLTVYISYGYLAEDMSSYAYRVWEDETLNNPELFTNPGNADVLARLPYSTGVTLGLVAAVAVALRWLVNRFEGVRQRPWLGLPASYVEVVASVLTVTVIMDISEVSRGWAEGRRVVRWVYDIWYEVSGALGPLTAPLRNSVSWLWGVVADSSTAVIVIPIAWLLVGAVVYGHRIATPPTPPATAGQPPVTRVRNAIAGRAGPLTFAIRLLFRTGALPILLFCLAFVVASSAGSWLWELERLLIGPHDVGLVWAPFSGPLALLNRTVEWVLLACLLAAAIDHVLETQAPSAGSAPADAQPAGPQPADPQPVGAGSRA